MKIFIIPSSKTAVLILLWIIAMSPVSDSQDNIKRPNVAGQFYTSNERKLSNEIDRYIKDADVDIYDKNIDVLISPHAGYMYSGGVAGYGFKAVSQGKYSTIVIIAPRHRSDFRGIAIWPEGGFETPMGIADIDTDMTKALLAANKGIQHLPEVFDIEHSLEVQIPFLQKTFKDFKIVPLLMGVVNYQDCQRLAQSLHQVIGDRQDVLIVASTDMSHYHPGDQAESMDQVTLKTIEAMDVEHLWNQITNRKMELCGFSAVVTSVQYAKLRSAHNVDVLKYAHSGDVTGDNSRVVGYTAIVLHKNGKDSVNGASEEKKVKPLNLDQKKKLVEIAKDAIHTYVNTGKKFELKFKDPRLSEMEGAFVTIHKHGQLRGCIGHIIGQQPLIQTVRDVAISAAVHDRRFKPLTKSELKDIDVEVSVLSKPWRIYNTDEIELGTHGVIVSRGPLNRGVYLPQVATETGWSKEKFLSNLCQHKAGLPADAWKDPMNTVIEIFTADVFDEKDVGLDSE